MKIRHTVQFMHIASADRPIRIMVVEDQTILRELLRDFFSRLDDFEVVSTFADGHTALNSLADFLPDILLLDYNLPDISGMEVFAKSKQIVAGIKVVFLSSLLDAERVEALSASKVHGVVHKNISLSELADGLRQVHAGAHFFRVEAPGEALHKLSQVNLSMLSEREKEVLKHIASGRLNKEIASELQLSVRTVEKHRENLKRKLYARETASLVRLAVEAGLV